MKHYRENGQKQARVRVSLDMLPRGVQRAHKSKQDDILKKMFKRACNAAGIFHEMKEREYYVKPGEKRRRAERLKKANARGEGRDREREYMEREQRNFDDWN